ncbi:MAG: sigma-70 family RNA polymerase sigma factor [Verrucomicrobiales bacterium]
MSNASPIGPSGSEDKNSADIVEFALPGASGDIIDWPQEFRNHEASLRKLAAHRMGEQTGAVDDIMQEVAIAVLGSEKTTGRPDDRQKVAPWLRSVTIHKVQDFWRKIQRSRRLRDRLENSPTFSANDDDQSPYDWVLRVENISAVREALDTLEAPDRELLEQKYREDVTCRELATRQGVAIKTIEYRLKQARAQLRRILNNSSRFSAQR